MDTRALRRFRAGVGGVIAAVLSCLPATAALPSPAGAQQVSTTTHRITWDHYSLMIDGVRTFIWSGEFHYWRLPSPGLWRDVLQRMKAEGYDAVSIYFDWGYHSPASGVYDFTGVRDVDRLLDIAAEVGLYVIARPGPYINAETTAGGFPGWLTTQAGRARTDAPDYLAAADQWLERIDRILARHQLTDGRGTVILYQIENELAATGPGERAYLRHLVERARADGIAVPIFHNDKGRHGRWVPDGTNVPGTVPGPTDLYAFDGYPGGTCRDATTPGPPNPAPDWGLYGPGGASGGASASPTTPGFTAEFGGGWFDYWGSTGTYPCTAVRQGPGYEKVFYGTNIANGLTIQNFYMTFGGTSWGWLPAPVVYTSYDYGAAIDEARRLRPKAEVMKGFGYFLQSVEPVAELDRADPVRLSSRAVKVYHDVNPETGTHLYVAMHDPSDALTSDSFSFTMDTGDGRYSVPRSGSLRIDGQDAKLLVADYEMDGQHLVYSTSQILTHFGRTDGDLALLHAPAGEDGETVLRYARRPAVEVLAGDVSSTWDPTRGDLRLDYEHRGLTEVRVSGGGRPPLTLLLADDSMAWTFWRQDLDAGPVLERGPALVRTATLRDGVLELTGDTRRPSDLEVWAPAGTHAVVWNGRPVPTDETAAGGRRARMPLPGPEPVRLPDLTRATWRFHKGSPEADPAFDDSGWARADRTATNSTTPPPAGRPVLTADDYGFHQGDVWYRGRWMGAPSAARIDLRYGGGGAGMLQAWMDGRYLGQDVLPTGVPAPATVGETSFPIPADLRSAGSHELSVMVRNDSHNEDGGVNDAHKEGRGLIAASLASAAGPLDTPMEWRIQGNRGGEDLPDPARGPLNSGGLYGERTGWYLPGFPDQDWDTVPVPARSAPAGTSWYRTTFTLDVPPEDDASLGITIGDPGSPRSDRHYRALIFVNGWNMGQYIADVGPQHTFVVPTGVLNPRGPNTLAIAVTSDGGEGNGLERVSLTNLETVRGGVPAPANEAPGYESLR